MGGPKFLYEVTTIEMFYHTHTSRQQCAGVSFSRNFPKNRLIGAWTLDRNGAVHKLVKRPRDYREP